MWGNVVSVLGPIAWGLVRERLLVQKAGLPGPAPSQRTDLDARLHALEQRLEALSKAQTKQLEEVARVLTVVGLRATVALWLSVASGVAVSALLAATVFGS